MEIIEKDPRSDDDLVPIAFAETREEAALIRGLLRDADIRSLVRQAGVESGAGISNLIVGSSRHVYVRGEDAARSRTLLAETMVEDLPAAEFPEPVNAAYLADATGHRPRNYGIGGFYLRTYAFAIAVFALALVTFIVLK